MRMRFICPTQLSSVLSISEMRDIQIFQIVLNSSMNSTFPPCCGRWFSALLEGVLASEASKFKPLRVILGDVFQIFFLLDFSLDKLDLGF